MPDTSPARLREFFNPASVAMVGATDSFRMSVQVHRNLELHGFQGELHLVNPRSPVVHGQRTVPSLSAIGHPVDMAFVVLGGDRVLDVASEAAELGIRNLVVLSGGFTESGPEGEERQRRLVELAAAHDQVILGPNTIGFVNVPGSTVLYGTRCAEPVPPGPVGIATQSGIMLTSSIEELSRRGVGFSVLAGVGNEAVTSIDDVLDYLVEDDSTEVIGLYLETTRNAARFRRAAGRALDAGKPIVALSGARTTLTADFAITHTGAIVGDHAVQRAAFAELGIISVTSLEDFYSTVAYLAHNGPMRGRRVVYTAVTGGKCELFADRAVEIGLELPPLAETTRAALTDVLPRFATVRNPLDCTGAAGTELITEAIRILAADPNVDAVAYDSATLALGTPDEARLDTTARTLGEVTAAAPVPVLPVGATYADSRFPGIELTRRHHLGYEIGGVEHGVLAMARSAWWTEQRADHGARSTEPAGPNQVGDPLYLGAYLDRPRTEAAALDLLESAGIGTIPHQVCGSAAQAAKAGASFGFPVAIKVSSPDIAHKSRIGAVALDIADEAAAATAYASVISAARRAHPDADIEGVLVTPMRTGGIELIAGIHRDRVWGPVLMLGFGGVWVETLQDSALSLLPTTRAQVERQLRGLRGAPLFAGGHGLEPTDLGAVAGHVLALTTLASDLGDQLQSLEINPLRVHGDAVEALDALIVLAENPPTRPEDARGDAAGEGSEQRAGEGRE
ncbi:MAG TPA: acetate--CoA ligase family protein [Mycobacterium sp.]|nr:acetate--CoA ligase family protein [Mycobacterium sp.]